MTERRKPEQSTTPVNAFESLLAPQWQAVEDDTDAIIYSPESADMRLSTYDRGAHIRSWQREEDIYELHRRPHNTGRYTDHAGFLISRRSMVQGQLDSFIYVPVTKAVWSQNDNGQMFKLDQCEIAAAHVAIQKLLRTAPVEFQGDYLVDETAKMRQLFDDITAGF